MSLQLIVGSMFSGKSTHAIQLCKQLQAIDEKIFVVKPVIDDRYNTSMICNHDGLEYSSRVIDKLEPVLHMEEYKRCNYIIIDEAQFFRDLFTFVTISVDTNHKHVIVIGLDGDSDRQNFGDIHKLLPLCDDIIKMKGFCSICKDGTKSIFSKRIVASKKQIDIGEKDKYIPVCRKCYHL
jgi:thymidine kinase